MAESRSSMRDLLIQLREDWITHDCDWKRPGFRAVAVYRIGHWLLERPPTVWRRIAIMAYGLIYRYIRNHYGIELPPDVTVGRRLFIAHQGGIVIHRRAVIGDDCLIRHGVTIGASSQARAHEAPHIGHRVQVGCGAAILGKITVGDGVRIGANAVVTTDVPAGARVVVPPPLIRLADPPVPDMETLSAFSECR